MTFYIAKTFGPLDLKDAEPFDNASLAHDAAVRAATFNNEDYSIYLVERVGLVKKEWGQS